MTDTVGVWDLKPEGGGAPTLVYLTAKDAADKVASNPTRFARDDGSGALTHVPNIVPVAVVNPVPVALAHPTSNTYAGFAQRMMDAHAGVMASAAAFCAEAGALQARIDGARAALKGEADKVTVG